MVERQKSKLSERIKKARANSRKVIKIVKEVVRESASQALQTLLSHTQSLYLLFSTYLPSNTDQVLCAFNIYKLPIVISDITVSSFIVIFLQIIKI